MNIQEALNVFGLSGDLTEKDIKAAYKKAALKYHPDPITNNFIDNPCKAGKRIQNFFQIFTVVVTCVFISALKLID
ncbi:TPA: DnaJ domain-containing protein, partial [Escherichia coli]